MAHNLRTNLEANASSIAAAGADTPYELRLRHDFRWAMSESTRFFQGTSGLQQTLRELAKKLDALGIAYAVVGGMALLEHGYARMTEDVDLLVTRADLKKIHAGLEGLGYRREFAGSKNLRDTSTQVKIEFVLSGDFPGSGKPQPLAFPNPGEIEISEHDGVKFIGLAPLIELKLASGMTGGPGRAKDLVDVQQLITLLRLPCDLAERLNEYVRPRYRSLWDELHAEPRRFVRLWRGTGSPAAADELRRMMADGISIEPPGGIATGRARLVTGDRAIAEKYGMHDESELFDEEAE